MEIRKGGVALVIPVTMQAITGDEEFIHNIALARFNGRIHSIFRRTVNIYRVEDGELYTIARDPIDPAPNTLIVSNSNFKGWNLAVNDLVFVRNNSLHIADKTMISIAAAKKWQCVLPEFPLTEHRWNINGPAAMEHIQAHGISGGMKKHNTNGTPLERELSRILTATAQMLMQELSQGRIDRARSHAVRLIGLGPELTPSGDDFLVGLFAALHVQNNPNQNPYLSFCADIASAAESRTNAISFMALKKASLGQVRQSIVNLIHSMIYGDTKEMIRDLEVVLHIGASSGTDLAIGILAGLELAMQNYVGGKECLQKL